MFLITVDSDNHNDKKSYLTRLPIKKFYKELLKYKHAEKLCIPIPHIINVIELGAMSDNEIAEFVSRGVICWD
jgi:hypothetical protein